MNKSMFERLNAAKGFFLVVNKPKEHCDPYKGFNFKAS